MQKPCNFFKYLGGRHRRRQGGEPPLNRWGYPPFLQRSEQYFTSSHTLAQALRQTIGRPQRAQIFCGKSPFLTIFAI